MRGARCRGEAPRPESESPDPDEEAQLELHLQRQLEEDVARIFDESIYSDLEVVCGKLKILTHSCILTTRTNTFYQKLQSILNHTIIGRESYDEIYSFISDAYTECKIEQQEKEILKYLNESFQDSLHLKTPDDRDVFSTPKCLTPNCQYSSEFSITASPSTELTKEYYALVPIDGNVLDKELTEQDALSNAFQSLNQPDTNETGRKTPNNKPTSLALTSSHISKSVKHSSSCDILNQNYNESFTLDSNRNLLTSLSNSNQPANPSDSQSVLEKSLDQGYSPDSLITDEPSSASDYLSVANPFSPVASISGGYLQFNALSYNSLRMDDKTSLDSGIDRGDPSESVRSQSSNVTRTDVSLTESTLQDCSTEDTQEAGSGAYSNEPILQECHFIITITNDSNRCSCTRQSNSEPASMTYSNEPILQQCDAIHTTSESSSNDSNRCTCPDQSKTEPASAKKDENGETLVQESSSLSSEAGSWQHVFPLNRTGEDKNQRKNNEESHQSEELATNFANISVIEQETQTPIQTFNFVSPFVQATPCYIDASSFLNNAQQNTIRVWPGVGAQVVTQIVEAPSKPLPCSTVNANVNPDENSEDTETDDSLEKTNENKDPDSPTIFDMTPITEDSLCTNTFEAAAHAEENRRNTEIERLRQNSGHDTKHATSNEESSLAPTQQFVLASTPHNSILTIKPNSMNPYEASAAEIENITKSLIVAGGASNHVPPAHSGCVYPRTRATLDTQPSNYGVYIPEAAIHGTRPQPPCPPAAWVVDMSKRHPDNENTSSSSITVKKPNDKQCNNLKNESNHSSYENGNRSRSSVESDSSERSSQKFYIDLSSLPDHAPPKQNENEHKEKNNMFSMYIGLDENKSTKKEMPVRLSSSLNAKKAADQNVDKKNTPKGSKNNEASTSNASNTRVKNTKQGSSIFEKYEFLCNDPNIALGDIMTLPKEIDKETGMEYPSTLPNSTHSQPRQAAKNRRVELGGSSNQWIESQKKKLVGIIGRKTHLSHSEWLANQQNSVGGKNTHLSHSDWLAMKLAEEAEEEAAAREAEELELKETEELMVREAEETSRQDQASNEPFVRLSDLDMVFLDPPKPEGDKKSGNNKEPDVRMTRSIPENSWRDPSNAASSSQPLAEVISSFHSENAVSLNRLFPNLRNDFSKSMPGSLSSRTRSPLRLPEGLPIFLDLRQFNGDSESEGSSMQSSMCPSVAGASTTEENSQTSSLIENCQSRLGQDLLRMFLEEIAPDVVVEVGGRRIKAHKCILSSRCQYFAGILSGGWVESSGNVIVMPDRFSYNVVYFALCHIYSGLSSIPESISIMELATIADMLGLEGLKEAIMFNLKAKYCHHFHKPCNVCIAGVMECFPLTSIYGLDELYHKCVKWIAKHFHTVWPTRAFATLPQELLDKCLLQLINSLTMENFVNITMGIGVTLMYLQNAGRWSDTVVRLLRRLQNGCASYAAPRLAEVLRALATIPCESPDELPPNALFKLRAVLAAAIEWAPPDSACRAYAFLNAIVSEMRMQHLARPDLIRQNRIPQRDILETYARNWMQHVEAAIVRAAPRVVGTQAYNNLPPELRRRLRELGCIRYGVQNPPSATAPTRNAPQPRNAKPVKLNNGANDIDKVRACFVPYAPRPPQPSVELAKAISECCKSYDELRAKVLPRNGPVIRTTKAQEERAKFNLSKNNSSHEGLNNKSQRPYDNTKPRYLEPRASKENVDKKMSSSARNRAAPKMFSSSESSRNSSPVQMRQLRSSRGAARAAPAARATGLSQDSLSDAPRPLTAEPSTDSQVSDSQGSNKYGTYTKAKQPIKHQSNQPKPEASTGAIKKVNTKIPVYLSHGVKNNTGSKQKKEKTNSDESVKVENVTASHASPRRGRLPGSLFSATKSSSAKMVPKVAKEASKPRQPKRQHQSRRDGDHQEIPPLMERSGTFLKDEPTFGDQANLRDIDKETE